MVNSCPFNGFIFKTCLTMCLRFSKLTISNASPLHTNQSVPTLPFTQNGRSCVAVTSTTCCLLVEYVEFFTSAQFCEMYALGLTPTSISKSCRWGLLPGVKWKPGVGATMGSFCKSLEWTACNFLTPFFSCSDFCPGFVLVKLECRFWIFFRFSLNNKKKYPPWN